MLVICLLASEVGVICVGLVIWHIAGRPTACKRLMLLFFIYLFFFSQRRAHNLKGLTKMTGFFWSQSCISALKCTNLPLQPSVWPQQWGQRSVVSNPWAPKTGKISIVHYLFLLLVLCYMLCPKNKGILITKKISVLVFFNFLKSTKPVTNGHHLY